MSALNDYLDGGIDRAEYIRKRYAEETDAQAEALGSVRSVCSNSDSLGIGADRDDVKERK